MTSSRARAPLTPLTAVQIRLPLQRRDLVPADPRSYAAVSALAQLLLEAAQPALEREEADDAP